MNKKYKNLIQKHFLIKYSSLLIKLIYA